MRQDCQDTITEAERLFDEASRKHFASYPFGRETHYKLAALLFQRVASLFCNLCIEKKCLESVCFYYDCLGDHNYYIFGNWRMASRCYRKAKKYAENLVLIIDNAKEKSFWENEIFYFQALEHETLAFTMEKNGDYIGAKKNYIKAIKAYEECLKREKKDGRRLLKHSIVGLWGGYFFAEGLQKERENDRARAKEFFMKTISLYRKALRYHPSWKNTGHMDDYVIWIEQVRKAIARVSD